MTTMNSFIPLSFTRTIEDCPYANNCSYANVCHYECDSERRSMPAVRNLAVSAGQFLLGAVLLLLGVGLSVTLFLLPLGLPLVLLGIAVLGTSGEAIERHA